VCIIVFIIIIFINGLSHRNKNPPVTRNIVLFVTVVGRIVVGRIVVGRIVVGRIVVGILVFGTSN